MKASLNEEYTENNETLPKQDLDNEEYQIAIGRLSSYSNSTLFMANKGKLNWFDRTFTQMKPGHLIFIQNSYFLFLFQVH